MTDGLYKGDLLTPEERETFEQNLISFCDRELDLLGDIGGLNVLYAGGASPLWIEGLSQRTGNTGTLTALDADTERVEAAQTLPRSGSSLGMSSGYPSHRVCSTSPTRRGSSTS